MKKAISDRHEKRQADELAGLADMPEEAIDTVDIPEVQDWRGARRGVFYRPVKRQLTLRLDADVVAWFKAQAPNGKGYQSEINRALREHVEQRQRKTG